MVVNFRVREISPSTRKLAWIPTLIIIKKIKKGNLASVMIGEKATITLNGYLKVQFIIN